MLKGWRTHVAYARVTATRFTGTGWVKRFPPGPRPDAVQRGREGREVVRGGARGAVALCRAARDWSEGPPERRDSNTDFFS